MTKMNNIIIFPRLDSEDGGKFDDWSTIVKLFIENITEGQYQKAELNLQRLFSVDNEKARTYVNVLLSKENKTELMQQLKGVEEILQSGTANEFVAIVKGCFGIERVESINLYLDQIKNNS